MRRCTALVLGMLAATLAGCGDDSPPVVTVAGGDGSGGQAMEAQLINLQNQVNALQQQVDMLKARLSPTPQP
jgi:hypothetical protein